MLIFFCFAVCKNPFAALFDFFELNKSENLVDQAKYGSLVQTGDSQLSELMETEFVVFGTETCGFTTKALNLLKDRGINHVFIDKSKTMKETYERT